MRTRFRNVALATIAAFGIALSAAIPARADDTPASNFGLLNASAATSANCTSQSCVTLPRTPLPSQSVCFIQVTGTFVGTIILEGSLTAANYVQQSNVVVYGGTGSQSSITAAGLYSAACAPIPQVRMTAYTSGTAQVAVFAADYRFGAATAAGTTSTNIAQVAGTTLSNTTGVPTTTFGKVNTVGQPCIGVSTLAGATVPSANQTTTLVPSTTQQIVALAASTVVHVCSFDVSVNLTTGGTFSLEYGTGTLCAVGTTVFYNLAEGVGTFDPGRGTGGQDLFSIPSGNALCIVSPAFVGTAFINTGTSQY